MHSNEHRPGGRLVNNKHIEFSGLVSLSLSLFSLSNPTRHVNDDDVDGENHEDGVGHKEEDERNEVIISSVLCACPQ